jgi:two-component system, chemotaxis family, protein-glutamate methylesterase/glutaminase
MSANRGHLVAIGASWGGLDTLRTILQRLPAELDAAVVVAQHRAPESHRTAFRDLLGAVTHLHVCEADDKDELEVGTVYIAAPDYHLLVEDGTLALSTEGPQMFARPSIDILLETAAESFREGCIGVILTGANDDGSIGLKRVVELGGSAIVQDPATATRTEMPAGAIAAVPDARVEGPEGIAEAIIELCGVRTAV